MRSREEPFDRRPYLDLSNEEILATERRLLEELHAHLANAEDIMGLSILNEHVRFSIESQIRLLDHATVQHMIDHVEL